MTEINHESLSDIYQQRFDSEVREERNHLWRVLCKFWIQRYIPENATVLDLAAGQCEFINNIHAQTKIAVDLNEDVKLFAAADVQVIIAWSHDMQGVADDSVDIVFVSNFFEHLPHKQALLDTLREIRRVLKSGGKLLVFQPNIRFLNGAYWDFIDHYLALTDRTLVEALELVHMRIQEIKPQFLPYTTRSRFPQNDWLVRLYLMIPLAHRIFGRQIWAVAVKP